MPADPEVFVYGATGYTGRLVCHYLAERGIRFVAGGRDLAKARALCEQLGPQMCHGVEVSHDERALSQAFASCKVVINCTGPFGLLGMTVVRAALAANCHYLDTTGEQDFMLEVASSCAEEARRKERVVITGNSWYYALGSCAVEYCLAFGALDDVRVIYQPRGKPTVASLQSLLRTARRRGYYLKNGKLLANEAERRHFDLPASGERLWGMAIPTGETVYYRDEAGLGQLKGYYVAEARSAYLAFSGWYYLSKLLQDRIDQLGDRLVSRFYSSPPPEDRAKTTFLVAVLAEGAGRRQAVEIRGSAPYIVTGFLCAEAASRLIEGEIAQVGVTSTARAFGAEAILKSLSAVGVVSTHCAGTSVEIGR